MFFRIVALPRIPTAHTNVMHMPLVILLYGFPAPPEVMLSYNKAHPSVAIFRDPVTSPVLVYGTWSGDRG